MNLVPTAKVTAATLAGAITTVLVWGLKEFVGVQLPGEVAAALTTIMAFAAGWITSESK